MNAAVDAIVLFSQLAYASSQEVVARPEVSTGSGAFASTISLRTSDRSAFGGYDAASDRGEAFVAERPGNGSINVTLRLPQYKDRCVIR